MINLWIILWYPSCQFEFLGIYKAFPVIKDKIIEKFINLKTSANPNKKEIKMDDKFESEGEEEDEDLDDFYEDEED